MINEVKVSFRISGGIFLGQVNISESWFLCSFFYHICQKRDLPRKEMICYSIFWQVASLKSFLRTHTYTHTPSAVTLLEWALIKIGIESSGRFLLSSLFMNFSFFDLEIIFLSTVFSLGTIYNTELSFGLGLIHLRIWLWCVMMLMLISHPEGVFKVDIPGVPFRAETVGLYFGQIIIHSQWSLTL